MKYNIGKIIENKDKQNYLFFWGHQPSKDGTITKTCFSQWWVSPFVVDNIEYKTAEHWMMAKKALLFKDIVTFEKIIHAILPIDVKKLGREVKNYEEEVWLKNRYKVVKEGNYHKFSQNNELKTFLLGTADMVLVEASPVDSIWGIGMDSNNKEILNPAEWKGLNLLGFALMEVRDELKNKQ